MRNVVFSVASGVFALTISVPALAQDPASDCADVLKYTGMEKDLLWSHEVGQRFERSQSSKSNDFGVSYARVRLSMTGSSARSNERIDSWDNEYLRAVETAYRPAVDAWLQCINASKQGFVVKANLLGKNNSRLHIQLLKPRFGTYSIQGFTDDQTAKCVLPYARKPPLRLSDNVVIVTCDRRKAHLDESNVVVDTNAGSFKFTMPEVPGRTRFHSEPDATEIKLRACSDHFVTEAVPYPRQFLIRDVSVSVTNRSLRTLSGQVYVLKNGETVIQGANEALGPGKQKITASGQKEVTVPAFTPAVFVLSWWRQNVDIGCDGKGGATLVVPPLGKLPPT